jgi:hypothetical protein
VLGGGGGGGGGGAVAVAGADAAGAEPDDSLWPGLGLYERE